MATVFLVLMAIGVTIYAAVDCVRSDDTEIRSLPKSLWLLLILCIPPFGGALWILLGRQSAPGSPKSRRLRTIGPDDDPDFLSSLQLPRARGERRRPEGPAAGPITPTTPTAEPDDGESDATPS
jgi:hypothetical protein